MADTGVAAAAPLREEPATLTHPLVDSVVDLTSCLSSLEGGTGPFALDAERAGGFRYSQRAYLIQIHREGSGTWLLDPVAFVPDDFQPLSQLLADDEWVLHAANQDLPCLAELGLRPPRLFDTELAGRLLGDERVGLSTMTERYLGFGLAKEHGAADWSQRPLPDAWLRYAALDVDVLLPLRAALAEALEAADKERWAAAEFEFVRTAPPAAPRSDPWRRIKGLSSRRPRELAVARELWQERDRIARASDLAPGRVLPDSAIADLTSKRPATPTQAARIIGRRRGAKRGDVWSKAIARGIALPPSDLPTSRTAGTDIPHHRHWDRLNPAAAARYRCAASALEALATTRTLPRENLLGGRTLRTAIWTLTPEDVLPPPACDESSLTAALREAGAREWQIMLVCDDLVAAIASSDRTPSEPVPTGE